MSSQIPSVSTALGSIIELIQSYGMDQKRRFEVLLANPLNCENLLNLLIATTNQPEKDPEYMSLVTQYTTQLSTHISTELTQHGRINIDALLSEILTLQQTQLTLPQQAQGTQAILSYLQTRAQNLIPQIMTQITTTCQEEPTLLLPYQKALTELIPYLFTHEYPPEVLKEAEEYIAYLTANPDAGSVEIPDDLSAVLNDMEAFQAKYMDIQESSALILPMIKEIQRLGLRLEALSDSITKDDAEPRELALLEAKKREIAELSQHIKQLSDELTSLNQMLTNSKDLLIAKDNLLVNASSHEDVLKGLEAQAKVLKFLFSVYNTDICMKKIMIQNKPQQLEQGLGLITSTPHAPLSHHTKKQLQSIFDSSKQEIIEANTLLGLQPPTEEIKKSELAAAIDGWLTNLDGVILSIETEEFVLESLNELIQDLHTIISQSTPLEDADAEQARLILQHLNHYTQKLNREELDWPAEKWVRFLTNEIKKPLERLIRLQSSNNLDDVMTQLDQLAASLNLD